MIHSAAEKILSNEILFLTYLIQYHFFLVISLNNNQFEKPDSELEYNWSQ